MDPMTPLPLTGNATLDHYLALAGVVVTLASAAATFLNARIRAALDAGESVPRPFLYLALVANYAAVNLDKTAQLHRLLGGGKVVVTRVGVKDGETGR